MPGMLCIFIWVMVDSHQATTEEVYTLHKAHLRVSEMTKQVETVSVHA